MASSFLTCMPLCTKMLGNSGYGSGYETAQGRRSGGGRRHDLHIEPTPARYVEIGFDNMLVGRSLHRTLNCYDAVPGGQ